MQIDYNLRNITSLAARSLKSEHFLIHLLLILFFFLLEFEDIKALIHLLLHFKEVNIRRALLLGAGCIFGIVLQYRMFLTYFVCL